MHLMVGYYETCNFFLNVKVFTDKMHKADTKQENKKKLIMQLET